MVFILQFATEKTNHGVKLYRRVARHIDVETCPVGSIAFYLFYQFDVIKEMEDPTSISLTTLCGLISNSSQIFVAMIEQRSWRTKTYHSTTLIDQTCKAIGISTKSHMQIGCKL